MSLKEFGDTLPDYAKDIRLNLSSILSDQLLGDQTQIWAVARLRAWHRLSPAGRGGGGRVRAAS